MSEAFETELRERIARLPADPPTGWSTDLRARLATAWEADETDTSVSPAMVVDLPTRRRRPRGRVWLVVAAATAAAAAAVTIFNVGNSKQVVKIVPPVSGDHPSWTVPTHSLPSNGKLVLDDAGTPRLINADGRASTPIPCTAPCPGGTGELWQITDRDRWSPDNKRAMYQWNYGIYVLDVQTGATRRVAGPCAGTGSVKLTDGTLTDAPGPGPSGWSPDGSRILYGCRGLHIVNLADDHEALITNACELVGAGCNGRGPDDYYIAGRWSPDGRSIAVTVEDPFAHTTALHIVDATTGSHRLVAPQIGGDTWLPDGRLVYWGASDTELRSVDSSGHDSFLARLPHPPNGALAPDLAHVAYITDYHDADGADVRVLDLVSGTDVLVERGAPHEHRYEGVQWSPDGTRLAISSTDHTVIVDPDGRHRVSFPRTGYGGLAWLPRVRESSH